MSSEAEICNRALQRLGAKRIVNLTDDSVNARLCFDAYGSLRDLETALHPWRFAMSRASLPADAVPPAFGKANSFQLPLGFLALYENDEGFETNETDYEVEGTKLLTNFGAPLNIRFIEQVTDTDRMHPIFRELLSCRLAFELCEAITQSNSKKESIRVDYDDLLTKAKAANAILRRPTRPPTDSWITGRS